MAGERALVGVAELWRRWGRWLEELVVWQWLIMGDVVELRRWRGNMRRWWG
jgi:hypothetical protein